MFKVECEHEKPPPLWGKGHLVLSFYPVICSLSANEQIEDRVMCMHGGFLFVVCTIIPSFLARPTPCF